MTRHKALALALVVVVGQAAACDAQERPGLDEAGLAAMIDSLLPPISEASGLDVLRPVQFAIQSRAEAASFIEEQLDAELGAEELAGMQRSYVLLGLLPDTLDLRTLLLELYTEQVVGYYDPATDRLYVVEGFPAATASPVVAHELVHALQDQHTALDSLVDPERGNDRQMAAQAAAEGQATLVMIALQAAETTGLSIDIGALPDLGPMMRPALESENAQFPVFQSAPRVIRETLLFPYVGGAGFVQALFRHDPGPGTPVPFGDLLPQSTEQVLEPERAFLAERDDPTEIELGDAGGAWSVVYSNTLGQFETTILLRELPGGSSDASASGWDGDRYALLAGPGGERALVWYSVWDDDASADRVARALVAAGDGWRVERFVRDGRPMVRALIAEDAAALGSVRAPTVIGMEERATR